MGAADLASSAASATPWGAIIQGGLGAIQTIGGMIQRAKGLKEAKKAIADLGPTQELTDIYNKNLQKYSGLRAGESMIQKQLAQQSRQNFASALKSYRDAGDIQAGGAASLRAANEAALKGATLGYQEQGQALAGLGSAAGALSAAKMRPKELTANLALQKAAGGSQVSNVGMSNIFGAGSSLAQRDLYKNYYKNTGEKPKVIFPWQW